MKISMKFFNKHDDIVFDQDDENISDVKFLFNSNINNVKIAVCGDLNYLLKKLNEINLVSGDCTGVYINDVKISGVESLSTFNSGMTTIVADVSSEPLFENKSTKKSSNECFLNIDYYANNVSI